MSTPSHIGPYAIERHVFRGNFCDVYRCRDVNVDRSVALKVARSEGVDRRLAARRLWHEAEVRGAIEHVHVLPLYRARRARKGSFLVGPWLRWGTLAERQLDTPPLDLLVTVADGIGAALDAVHDAGWLHIDLNPRNVLFGGDHRAVLGDFSSARRIGTRLLRRGHAPAEICAPVLPPEAWDGQPLNPRSDLYALGAVLYRVATGRYPFHGKQWQNFPDQHRFAPVPPPSHLSESVGPHLEAVLLRALAKEPESRFGRGGELAAAVRRALAEDGVGIGGRSGGEARLASPEATTSAGPDGPPPAEPVPASAALTREALARAGERLQHFAAGLDERERTALRALLAQSGGAEATTLADVASMTTQLFAVPSAMVALEAIGASHALALGPATAGELAERLRVEPRKVASLLEVLAAAQLLGRRDDRYELPPPLAIAYRSPRRSGRPPRPIHEGAELWRRLTPWTLGGEPYVQMDRADGSGYSPVVGLLGGLFAERAERLAASLRRRGWVPPGAAILDIGAGSAVWSLALAAEDPMATVTAVDRPAVLETAATHAEASGLGERVELVAGDWREVELPGQAFDLALLANVCHLEPEEEVAALLARLTQSLRPNGLVVIVDTIPDHRESASLATLLHGLRLALRSAAGGIHDRASLGRSLSAAGLGEVALLPLDREEPGLSALVARLRDRSGER